MVVEVATQLQLKVQVIVVTHHHHLVEAMEELQLTTTKVPQVRDIVLAKEDLQVKVIHNPQVLLQEQ